MKVRRVAAYVGRVVAALWLTGAVVAGVLMVSVTSLLKSAQADQQAAYGMGTLTGFTWSPTKDDHVVAAFTAWQAAGTEGGQTDQGTYPVLELVQSLVLWHVRLDAFLVVPAVTVALWWMLRRSLTRRSAWWPFAIALTYAVLDWTETWVTGRLASEVLVPGATVAENGMTHLLPPLTMAKWLVLLGGLLVALLASLSADRPLRGVRRGLLHLWAVRVHVTAFLVFGLLVGAPVPGPMDQIPDLLRSAHDGGWNSWAFALPTLVLAGLATLMWASGLLVVGVLRATPRGPDPVWWPWVLHRGRAHAVAGEWLARAPAETGGFRAWWRSDARWWRRATRWWRSDARAWRGATWWRTRGPWLVLLVVSVVAAVGTWSIDALQPSRGVFAVPVLLAAGLVLDLLLHRLRHRVPRERSAAVRFRVGPEDADAVEWWTAFLVAGVLAVGGLGAVRAYGVLVLLQVGDPSRDVHPGAVEWLLFGVATSTVVPIAVCLLLTWLARRPRRSTGPDGCRGRFALARGLVLVLTLTAWGLGVWTFLEPQVVGPALGAHGVVALWLAVVVSVLGLLQWRAEAVDAIPLARAFGLGRTPWIAFLLLVPVVVSVLDDRVGYHATTLQSSDDAKEGAGTGEERPSLEDAFAAWQARVRQCRPGATEVPLVLVAAPGGGARAAYWTTRVMAGLQAEDSCGGDSVFAASGVSGGSVGLAMWEATRELSVAEGDDGQEEAYDQLTALVGPDALDATMAALLFRDVPRGFVPVHLPGHDRAAVEQGVWVDAVPGLADPFLPDDPLDASGDGWDPLLLLNGSDLGSGCKVLMSQARVLPPGAGDGDSSERAASACRQHPDTTPQRTTTLEAGGVDGALFLDPADCREESAEREVDLAAAALLSARFPYVSPLGVLTRCGAEPSEGRAPREHLFVGDGGYLENTGLHSLLALWNDLEPLVRSTWRQPGDPAPQPGDAPEVVPVVVMVENHSRSRAVLRSPDRLGELSAPPRADRASLVASVALEQVVAAEFGRYERVEGDAGVRLGRWFVLAPHTRPSLSAPLGWSLSEAARDALDCEVPAALPVEGFRDEDCPGDARPSDQRADELVDLMRHP